MNNLSLKINNALNIFYKSTGINAIFSDTKLNLLTYHNEKKVAYDFSVLGMSEISSYLAEVFSNPPVDESDFYTYFLPNNFIFNIAFIIKDKKYIGAFVTEPLLVKSLSKNEIEELTCYSQLSLKDKNMLENMLLKIPVVPHDKIMPIGTVLHGLSKTLFEKESHQILRGSSANYETNNPNIKVNKSYDFSVFPMENVSTYSSYFPNITNLIKSGNTELLIKALDEINIGKLTEHNLCSFDFIRSLKNNFIRICSMTCYIAIEANVPYKKAIDITNTYIDKVENLQNINDIYILTKEALISITNTIAKSLKNSYSKYVNNVMNYIEQHYSEKISLKMLAERTNLSPYYLSKQIKKETDLNLLDNINNIRVEKSKDLLLNTNMSILDVAQKVGYNYQNHFAANFKKFTGLSPNEFRKTLGHKESLNKNNYSSTNFSKTLVEKIYIKLSMSANLFDTARIIDPINHKFLVIKSRNNNVTVEKCCYFKNQNYQHENCIFITAYLQNENIFKVYNKGENIFLVAAIPVTSENVTYIVEIQKNVSNKLLININDENKKNCHINIKENFLVDKNTAFTITHSRMYIDKKLNMNIRSSTLYKKSLFIILFTIENLNSIKNKNVRLSTVDDCIINILSSIISGSLITPKDWLGHYTKNIFLLALNDTDYKNVIYIAKKIREKFNTALLYTNKKHSRFTLKYGIASYSDSTTDSETFIKQAFMNMN